MKTLEEEELQRQLLGSSEVPVTSEVIALPRKRGRPKKTAPKSSVFELTKSPPRKHGRPRKKMD